MMNTLFFYANMDNAYAFNMYVHKIHVELALNLTIRFIFPMRSNHINRKFDGDHMQLKCRKNGITFE